jgi:triosephosphate isomerase
MHGLRAELAEAEAVMRRLDEASFAGVDVMICPPATLIPAMCAVAQGSRLLVGGQDCHRDAKGAHTGDIAAEMLRDAGACAVIVGHSERRAAYGERDADVRAKAAAAHRAGLTAIVCVGETAEQRARGETLEIVARQLTGSLPDAPTAANTVVAYEPVWAIGTGVTPRPQEIGEVHARVRGMLVDRLQGEGQSMRILYGGSVTPDNARALLAVAEVNGALVGGASLKAATFLPIVAAMAPQRA